MIHIVILAQMFVKFFLACLFVFVYRLLIMRYSNIGMALVLRHTAHTSVFTFSIISKSNFDSIG